MAVIETLSIAFVARTKKFSSGLARISKQVGGFAKSIARTAAKVGALGGALVGVAGIGGLLLMFNAQASVIDQTAKFADVIGVTTEQMVGYQLAAKITGVEMGQLNTGLQRFQKNIADADAGLSTARRAFKNLGLDPARLKIMSTHGALLEIGDALGRMDNQFTRTQTVLDLFGRSGLALTKFLNLGREGIEGFIAEAKKLGLSFNRVDAAKVEAANDALERMRSVITGIARTAAIELAPFVEAFANKIVELGTVGEGIGQAVVGVFRDITVSIARAADFMNLLKAGWYGFQGVVQNVTGFVLVALGSIAEAIVAVLNKIPGVDIQGPNLALDTGTEFALAAQRSFSSMDDALAAFDNQANSTKVASFFDDIRRRAEDAAIAATSITDRATAPQIEAPMSRNPFGARAIDFETTFVGALNDQANKEQKVRDPQIAETNKLLARIERGLGGGNVAVAG